MLHPPTVLRGSPGSLRPQLPRPSCRQTAQAQVLGLFPGFQLLENP
jgi:hypothetical protein